MHEQLLLRIQSALILVAGLMFTGFGVFFLASPETLAEMVGMGFLSSDAVAEIRAFYGGLELGIGMYLLWITTVARVEVLRRAGILAIVLMFGGSAMGRFSHWLTTGQLGAVQTALLVFELGYALICAWSLWHKPRLDEEPLFD